MGPAVGRSQWHLVAALTLCLGVLFGFAVLAPSWQPVYAQAGVSLPEIDPEVTPAPARPNLFWHIVKSAGICFGPLFLIFIALMALIVLLAMTTKVSKGKLVLCLVVIGALGPLLVLFSTVLGMILSFRELGKGGQPNPAKLAEGISHTLVVVLLGLAQLAVAGGAILAVYFLRWMTQPTEAVVASEVSFANHAKVEPGNRLP